MTKRLPAPRRGGDSESLTIRLGAEGTAQLDRLIRLEIEVYPEGRPLTRSAAVRHAIRRELMRLVGRALERSPDPEPLRREYLALYDQDWEQTRLRSAQDDDAQDGDTRAVEARVDTHRPKGGA